MKDVYCADNTRYAGLHSAGWDCCGIHFPGCPNEFGIYFGCKAFENHLSREENHLPGKDYPDWLRFAEPIWGCNNLDDIAAIYDPLTYSELDILGLHLVCNADTAEEGATSSGSPVQVAIPSFSVTPSLKVRDLATEVFSGKDCKVPVETRLGVVRQPKKHDAFAEDYSKRLGFLPSSISRTMCSTLLSREVCEHVVKLITPNSDELVDDRLCVVKRESLALRKPKTVHVGPLALNLVNYGSRESDLCQAGVFIDSRHAQTENAVLGAYACRVNNEEQALLFFPGSVLPLNPRINEVLKVRFGISNLDLEDTYQLFQSTAIVQTWANVQGHRPTKLTRQGEVEERLIAQRFKNNHCQVISTFADRYRPCDTSVELPRSVSMRQSGTSTFEVVDAPRRSILIKGVGTPDAPAKHPLFANADSQGVSFPEHLVDTNNDVNNLLYSDSITLETSTSHGKRVFLATLETLILSGNGKARDRLATCPATNCCIRVEIEGGQGPLIGAGLVGAYAEGTKLWTGGFRQIFNVDHFVMNPFVEDKVIYHFRPFAHMGFWHPIQCLEIPAAFGVFFCGPYTNPPKTSVTLGIKFYIDKCSEFVPRPLKTLETVSETGGLFLCGVELKQGVINQVKRIPFFPGNAGMAPRMRSYSQTNAILSQYAAVSGEVEIGIFVYSSTLIKGYVNVSLVPNLSAGDITIDYLLSHPQVTQPLQPGENILTFSVGDKNGLFPTLSPDLQWSEGMVSSMTLVIWAKGTISSQIDGSWLAQVYMRRFKIDDRQGYGLVHVHKTYGNAGNIWKAPDWWHNVYFWDFKSPLRESLSHDLDLHSLVMSVFDVSGKDNTLLRACPAALQILSTSTFAKAKILVKVTWWKMPNVKVMDCVHVVSATTFPDGVEMMPQDHAVSSEASGTFVFSYLVQGPFDGLRFVGDTWEIAGQSGEPALRVSLDGPSTCRSLSISAKVEELWFGSASNGWNLTDANAKLNEAF